MGNVDWGDSDGGERLWLSDTKTDPLHPVQTNQSPLYIAKSYIVHSAHCVVHLSCVNQPISAAQLYIAQSLLAHTNQTRFVHRWYTMFTTHSS